MTQGIFLSLSTFLQHNVYSHHVSPPASQYTLYSTHWWSGWEDNCGEKMENPQKHQKRKPKKTSTLVIARVHWWFVKRIMSTFQTHTERGKLIMICEMLSSILHYTPSKWSFKCFHVKHSQLCLPQNLSSRDSKNKQVSGGGADLAAGHISKRWVCGAIFSQIQTKAFQIS